MERCDLFFNILLLSITEQLLSHSAGWMVYERWCGRQLHHTLCAPGQPIDGSWVDSARTRHVVSVPVFESFCSNVKLRCMEHLLHITAKHFVQTIAPHFGKKRGALESDSEGDPASDGNEDEDSDGEDEDEAIDAGNSLGKAIALVKQVCFSRLR